MHMYMFHSNNRGFSLIEVLAGIAVMTVVLGLVFKLAVTVLSFSNENNQRSIDALVLQSLKKEWRGWVNAHEVAKLDGLAVSSGNSRVEKAARDGADAEETSAALRDLVSLCGRIR